MTQDTWNPQQYEKFKAERSQPFFDLLALVQRGGEGPGMHLVDLGCGTGELTAHMHRSLGAASSLGIDRSKSMLAKARAFEGSGLAFREQEIASFTPEAALDLLFANASLQWCADHESLFPRLATMLKHRPGAQIAIQMPMNHDTPTHRVADELAERWRAAGDLPSGARAYPLLSYERYAEILHECGFAEQNVFLKVYPHLLPSREEALEWVKGTLLTHYESLLGPNLYSRFLSEYRSALFGVFPDRRPFFYPFKRLFIWGRMS